MEHFKTIRGKPGSLYEGFRFRKDRNSKTEPRRPIFLQRGSNTSSWPRKSCEYIGASVTPKLSANAPLLCAQVYDRRKRNLCKMSANVIAPFVILVISHLCFESRTLVLIALAPGHCAPYHQLLVIAYLTTSSWSLRTLLPAPGHCVPYHQLLVIAYLSTSSWSLRTLPPAPGHCVPYRQLLLVIAYLTTSSCSLRTLPPAPGHCVPYYFWF